METPSPRVVLRSLAHRPTRVVVLRALQLGDLLCAVPALRALRAALPQAHVTLLGLPWERDFVERFRAYLDEFIEFPGYPGLPERDVDLPALERCLAALRARAFDMAIQLQGNGRITNDLVLQFGARCMAGFTPGAARADLWFTPDVAAARVELPGRAPDAGKRAGPSGTVLATYPEQLSEPRRLLYLVEQLGAPPGDERLEFPITAGEGAAWHALREREGLVPHEYVCLHAGARDPARRWPIEAFARVALALSQRGLRIVLTGHGAEEAELARQIASACGVETVDLTTGTPLGVLAVLLREAAVTVCNDTGVSHVAAAVGAPSVVIFRTTDPKRWAPADARRHRVVRDGAGAVEKAIDEALRLIAGEGIRAA